MNKMEKSILSRNIREKSISETSLKPNPHWVGKFTSVLPPLKTASHMSDCSAIQKNERHNPNSKIASWTGLLGQLKSVMKAL